MCTAHFTSKGHLKVHCTPSLQDALLLHKTAQNAVQQIQQKWPEMFPSARITKSKRLSSSGTSNISPGLKTEVEAPNDVLELFSSVKEYKVSAG